MSGVYRMNRTQNSVGRINTRRVAVASAFSPLDIAGLHAWYDFSDADTMFTDAGSAKVQNDGDLIYQINDKSGNNRNAIQTGADYRLQYKVNIKNGRSAGWMPRVTYPHYIIAPISVSQRLTCRTIPARLLMTCESMNPTSRSSW